MKNKITAPRGTKDLLPEEATKRRWLEEKAYSLFTRYNYKPIVTPIFEFTEVFERGVGEATEIVQKEMYTFTDRGGRSLTLRPEGTAPVVRAYLEHSLDKKYSLPVKLFYSGPMYRFERPQSGRQREFWQVGAEILGVDSPVADAEIILLLVEFLKELGAVNFDLMINSMGCPQCRPSYLEELKSYLKKTKQSLCSDCQRRYELNPLRVFDCKEVSCGEIIGQAPKLLSSLCSDCRTHFDEVKRLLKSVGLKFAIKPDLVRGLDYYRRTTFEIVSSYLGAQNALGGGGRYDGLAEDLGGQPTPGIGFAAGVERILLHLEKEGVALPVLKPLEVFLIATDSSFQAETFWLAWELRRQGFTVDFDFRFRKVGNQLKLADKLKARYALFLGEREKSKGVYKVKEMASGREEEVPENKVVGYLEKKLQEER